MEFDREKELIVRKALATMAETEPLAGYVIPSPRYCSDIADYWNQCIGVAYDTKKDVETNLIAATWIYPIGFRDDLSSGGHDSPLMLFTYEMYMFRQYGLMREDEDDAADIFSKKVLVQHNDIIGGWLGLKAMFQRTANVEELADQGFSVRQTQPLVQIEGIANRTVCEFVPGAIGYAIRLQETVRLMLKEC